MVGVAVVVVIIIDQNAGQRVGRAGLGVGEEKRKRTPNKMLNPGPQ